MVVLLLIVTVLPISSTATSANIIMIKDIKDHYAKYDGKELLITGEVKSLLFRETKRSFNKSVEINVYLIGDETSDIYLLTTKQYEEKEKAVFTAKILTKSGKRIKDPQIELYDRHILLKLGYTLPTLSKKYLRELLKKNA